MSGNHLWSQEFDFTHDDGGWAVYSPNKQGRYRPDIGWKDTFGYNGRGLTITLNLANTTLTNFDLYYTITVGACSPGAVLDNRIGTNNTDGLVRQQQPATGDGSLVLSWSGSESNVTQLHFWSLCSALVSGADGGGSLIVQKVVISGIGENPFFNQEGCKECGINYIAIDDAVALGG